MQSSFLSKKIRDTTMEYLDKNKHTLENAKQLYFNDIFVIFDCIFFAHMNVLSSCMYV